MPCRRGIVRFRVIPRIPGIRHGPAPPPVRYIRPMALTSGTRAAPLGPRGLALMLGWRRVAFTLTLSTLIGLALSNHWGNGPLVGLIRVVPLGFMAMLTFGLFEQWPRRLPRWLERWVL